MLTLKNRTCVFAGGTGEIGRKAVEYMLKDGMNVVLVTHNRKDAEAIVKDYEGPEGKCVIMDNVKDRKDAYRQVYEQFGSLDVFISKTGQLEKPLPLDEFDPNVLNELFDRQVTNVFKGIMDALPYLRESKHGRILLFSNIGSFTGSEKENLADYIVRASVNSMVLSLSRLLAKDKITVNGISFSGLIQDHKGKGLDSNDYLDEIPLKRIGTSEDLGALVEYLVSEESRFVTGEIIRLSGGLGMGL